MARHLKAFIGFLRDPRDFIVETGLPPEPFEESRWLLPRRAENGPSRPGRSG
jgi:hypothetical protein